VETLPRAKNAAAREKLLNILNSDVSRLDRLVTDISSSSRLDIDLARARAEPINLPLFVGDIVGFYENMKSAQSVDVVFETGLSVPDILYGAEEPLARVLQNLIDNAITFSPEGGKVLVRLSRQENEAGEQALLEVEDQGPGIPPENLETIFRRFYTDRPKGHTFGTHSGLGLSIVRQIVKAHKGEIHAENVTDSDGKITGARFVVQLPLNLGQ
jgi:two-component system sensor histidine kinase ChvG